MKDIKIRIGKKLMRRLYIMRMANLACREYDGKVIGFDHLVKLTMQYMSETDTSFTKGEVESCLLLLLGLL